MKENQESELRCFIGAFLEPDSIERLGLLLQLPAGLRRVDPATWHVTLRFLGLIPAGAVPEVLAAVEALAGHPLEVEATGFIGLPGAAHALVVAVEVAEHPQLAAWANQLAQRFGPADRSFLPHVTVARSRRPLRFLRRELALPLPIRLEAPALYRSHLGRAGARYERVVLPVAGVPIAPL